MPVSNRQAVRSWENEGGSVRSDVSELPFFAPLFLTENYSAGDLSFPSLTDAIKSSRPKKGSAK
jgi:hypothetical protein